MKQENGKTLTEIWCTYTKKDNFPKKFFLLCNYDKFHYSSGKFPVFTFWNVLYLLDGGSVLSDALWLGIRGGSQDLSCRFQRFYLGGKVAELSEVLVRIYVSTSSLDESYETKQLSEHFSVSKVPFQIKLPRQVPKIH